MYIREVIEREHVIRVSPNRWGVTMSILVHYHKVIGTTFVAHVSKLPGR